MIDLLQQRVYDILQADPRLWQGGNAWEPGFGAVARVKTMADWTAGKVNLVEDTYDKDTANHRPAIYLGHPNFEASDKEDFVTCNGRRVEHRILLLPLVVACMAGDRMTARRMRNQLRGNIIEIMQEHIRDAGHWWELTLPGEKAGGAAMQKFWISDTGGGSAGAAESLGRVPLVIKYRQTLGVA